MVSFIDENRKCRYTYKGVSLSFGSRASYTAGGVEKHLSGMAFGNAVPSDCRDGLDRCTKVISADFEDGDYLLTRQIAFNPEIPSQFRTRLILKNNSPSEVILKRLSPFLISGSRDISLGASESKDWIFYRQGRHKNDLPSVCTLGKKDESFFDAIGGLLETGGKAETGGDTSILVSDQLTILKTAEPGGENLLIGFLTGYDQLFECTLSMDTSGNIKSLQADCIFDIVLPSGSEAVGEWVRIDCREDVFRAIDEYAQDKAGIYRARKGKNIPSVFCTWYYYGLTVSYEDVITNLYGLKEKEILFDVYQVDEGWEITLGNWRPNHKFPLPMKAVADEIKAAGFTAGIWTSPFITHETAPVSSEHPEWLLCHKDGTRCLFPMNGTVYYVLDITNPEVVKWVEDLYKVLTLEWGYTYHKLDFTRAPVVQENAVYHDNTITLAQAYRRAVEAVRRGVGDSSYILMCGGLYDPIIGIVDGQRSGSDVLSMWSDPIRKGGKAAPFTIKQNALRYWMNRWWDNDPDALMVRRQKEPIRGLHLTYGLLTDEEVKTVALNQYFGGGLVCSTEPVREIDDDRLYVLRHVMPVVKINPVPRDLFSGERYPSVIDCEVAGRSWHTVSVTNWSDDKDMPLKLRIDDRLLGEYAKRYESFTVSEFYSGRIIYGVKRGDVVEMGTIKPHGSANVKIIPSQQLPAVVHSDGHYSMGGELERLGLEGKNLIFELDWKFNHPVTYKIKLPEGIKPVRLPEGTTFWQDLLEVRIFKKQRVKITVPLEY